MGKVRLRTAYEKTIWLDPGKTTGWASYGPHDEFLSGELGFSGTGNMVECFAELYGSRLAVGCEKFIVTASGSQKADPEYSLKTIGMVEWLCYRHGSVLLPEMPSASRNLGRAGGKLAKLGWYKPGQGHANDASAHLLAWLLKEGRLPIGSIAKLFTE